LLSIGQKVGASEANLLAKLDIKPFSYGLSIKIVYDNGALYDAKILDLTDDDIIAKFSRGVSKIAAIGLQIGYPTVASIPHSLARGYKNIASIALETDYSFPKIEKMKQYLANPSAFAVTAPPPSTTTTKDSGKDSSKESGGKGGKKDDPPPKKDDEEEDGMGFGLFGDE